MPKDKGASHARIVPAAKKEFLEKGYEKASMRSIAEAAGMTSAGLYRHFEDKEAMFAALVEPLLEKLQGLYTEVERQDYEYLNAGDMDSMWERGMELTIFLPVIYDNWEEFKLLICCSTGTRYEHFIHDLVMIEQEKTLEYLEAAREKGVAVKQIEEKELHLLLSAYATALFEVVVHDFTREEAVHYMKTIGEFFYPGWRAVLGL